MDIDRSLNEIFAAAYNEARAAKHEYITPEHILYAALFFDDSRELIKNCGADIEKLKLDIKSYLEAQGIEVELFQEAIGHLIYPTTIDGMGRVQIFVSKENAKEARKLLKQFQENTDKE
jgi:ATP-dependent Clp protease ATP-binding subunit ClpA